MTSLLTPTQLLIFGLIVLIAGVIGGIVGSFLARHIRRRLRQIHGPKVPQLYQGLHIDYLPTPRECVDLMLDVASVGPGDVVFDLGSGDGRVVIAAAKRGAKGVGIEINPIRLTKAKANAQEAGVDVEWREEDLFRADLTQATVVTAYLTVPVLAKLAVEQFPKLKGVRVVSLNDIIPWLAPKRVEQASNGYWVYLWELT